MGLLVSLYNVDLSASQLSPKEGDTTATPDENATIVLKDKNEWDKKTYADGWVERTSEVTGKCYQMIDGKGKLLYEFKYYLYDNDKTAWVFLKKTPTDSEFVWDSQTVANVTSGGVESYQEHAQGCITFLMQKEASDKGARSEFRNVANKTDFASATADFKVSAPKATQSQLMAEELMHAIIALNTNVFGSSLDITYTQFELELQQQQGKSIVVPTIIDIGADNAVPTNKKTKENKKDLTDTEKEKYGEGSKKYEYTNKDGTTTTEYVQTRDNSSSVKTKITKDADGNVVETSREETADGEISSKTVTKKIVDKDGKEKAITTTETYSNEVHNKVLKTDCVVGDFDSKTNGVVNGKKYTVNGTMDVNDEVTNSVKDGTYDSVLSKSTGSQAKEITTVDTTKAQTARTTNAENVQSAQTEKTQKETEETSKVDKPQVTQKTPTAEEVAKETAMGNSSKDDNTAEKEKAWFNSSYYRELRGLEIEFQNVRKEFYIGKKGAIQRYKNKYGKNPPSDWLHTQEALDMGFNPELGEKMNSMRARIQELIRIAYTDFGMDGGTTAAYYDSF
jgi:hypothetical protein